MEWNPVSVITNPLPKKRIDKCLKLVLNNFEGHLNNKGSLGNVYKSSIACHPSSAFTTKLFLANLTWSDSPFEMTPTVQVQELQILPTRRRGMDWPILKSPPEG
jgi:hypothetical protein